MEKIVGQSRELVFFFLVSFFFPVVLCFKMFAASGPFKVMFFVFFYFPLFVFVSKCLALNWPVVSGQKPSRHWQDCTRNWIFSRFGCLNEVVQGRSKKYCLKHHERCIINKVIRVVRVAFSRSDCYSRS